MEDVIIYSLIVTRHGRVKDVSMELIELPEVENVHELLGQYDIIAKIKLKSNKEIEPFLSKYMRQNPNIERTETLMVSDIPSTRTE